MDDDSFTASSTTGKDGTDGIAVEPTQPGGDHIVEVQHSEASKLQNGDTNGFGAIETVPSIVDHDKSDSEAETVVLSEKKESASHKTTKAIKLEDAGYASEAEGSDAQITEDPKPESTVSDINRRTSLKRKRGKEEPKHDAHVDTRDSSVLSSTSSSPAPQAHSSKTSGSRSERSPSSPPIGDDSSLSKLRKRNTENEKQSPSKQRRTREVSSETADAQDRRETRSATHYEEPPRRSNSPLSRNTGRARSTQSNAPPAHAVSKRRKPAPLYVDRTRASEDFHPESDDDSSVHSHQRLQRLQSNDMNILSPAKVSHKKNIDRSGRTLLARACVQGPEEAERWIRERPQDINVPDNAGNTPLQSASIHGKHLVVETLINAGCDITCKNIDLDTPLIDAVENSHVEVVKLLLKAGVDSRQRNAKGQEPLELVDLDHESGEEVRSALLLARRDSEASRRQSEDHKPHGSRDADTPSNATGASPTEGNRSPPPMQLGGRKRTARSQLTSDALLWVNAEPRRLREEAGKGNMAVVDHILKMRPEANTDAVLAAVKGGHDDVLSLMIAVAVFDPDPEPHESADHRLGHSTPMLAAIGRGNLDIVSMLLALPGFNPTRRVYRNMTYPEISEDRKGENWEDECSMLQKAIDDYHQTGGRRSNTSSPRRIRTKRAAPKQESPEGSSSPHEIRKVRRSIPPIKEDSDQDPETKRKTSYQGTAIRQRGHDAPSVSDPQSGRPSITKTKAGENRNGSDDGTVGARPDVIKPRRKLISGNELRSDQEARKKARGDDEGPPGPGHAYDKPKARQSFSTHDRPRSKPEEIVPSSNTAKKAASEEPPRPKDDSGRKRLRVSVSPQASRSNIGELSKKKKRQRVNSLGKSIDQARNHPASPPSIVSDVVESPTSVKSPPQATAPVAFMGGSTSATMDSHVNEAPDAVMLSPVDNSDLFDSHTDDQPGTTDVRSPELKQEDAAKLASEQVAAKRRRESEVEQERQALIEKEQAEYVARMERQAEEARIEAARQKDEAERRAQMEREAEEARLANIKREEELHRRRMEDERQRKEEQERRRREREERENLRRLRQQREEEQARIEALPNGLRRAAELGPERARNVGEITKWLPLRVVTTQDLEPGCDRQVADEQWIANIQAAPLLANRDLELSQCKSCHCA